MLAAFGFGKYVGHPFINKYGKYVGITRERWNKVQLQFQKNSHKTILFGFYMPGIRQVCPYFAGIAQVPFFQFVLFSLLGTLLWIFPFIAAGYFAGTAFNINPKYVPYIGVFFLFIFVMYVFIKLLRKKKQNHSPD